MRPEIPPRNITADVVARFLTRESLQSVRANTGVAFDEIYRILQGLIRSLLEQHVSRTRADAEAERQALQRSITEKNQQLAACGTHLGRQDAEIADLRERLQQKEEKLVGYIEKLSLAETAFVDQERTMGEMREEVLGLQEGLEAAKQQISCLTENQMISDNARDQLIQELLATMAKEREEEEDMQDKMDKCRSQQGKLMRQIRTQRSQHAKYVQQTRVKLAGFHVKLREAQERLEAPSEKTMIDMESVVSSVSPVRADIFREMIDLARQPAMGRRYSPNPFHMAVVLLFRSRSAYEFLRNFLPLPAPSTIYEHFHDDLKNSVNRLTSFNQIAGYLDSRITQHPEIAEAAVLAVDAIACTNTFVGMKQVEEGKVAYLFVVYLQPPNPKAKCSPLFIIESPSGMASDEIQTHIDTIIRITQSRMDRVFLASDGDPSYNGRHHTFMALWEQTYNAWGLERVLTDLKDYRGVGPISDMFHLGKNLRA
jgi:predicted  nucleic acid-binding Zn-ribbon protein